MTKPVTINFEKIAKFLNENVPAETRNPVADKLARLEATTRALNEEDFNASPEKQDIQLQVKLLTQLLNARKKTSLLEKGSHTTEIDGTKYTVYVPYRMICRDSKDSNEKRWEVLENKKIGSGGYGEVYKSLWVLKAKKQRSSDTSDTFDAPDASDAFYITTDVKASHKAVKITLHAEDKRYNEALRTEYMNARKILNQKAHYSEIQGREKQSDTKTAVLFINYIQGRPLSPKLVAKLSFDERVILAYHFLERLFKDLHQKSHIHGDLKPENALFNTNDFSAQPIDFGVSHHKDSDKISLIGTVDWMHSLNIEDLRKRRKTVEFDSFPAAGMLGIIFGCQDVLAERTLLGQPSDAESKNEFIRLPLELSDMFSTIPNNQAIPPDSISRVEKIVHSMAKISKKPAMTAEGALNQLQSLYQTTIMKNINLLNEAIDKAIRRIEGYLENNNKTQNAEKIAALNSVKSQLSDCKVNPETPSSFETYKTAFCATRKVLDDFNRSHQGQLLERVEGFTLKRVLNFIMLPLSFVIGTVANSKRLTNVGFFRAKSAQVLEQACAELTEKGPSVRPGPK
jgi:serine/threonine protein kinase